MLANKLIIDAFERIKGDVRGAVEGLSEEQLAWRPDDKANSIAWLIWHVSRGIDSQLASVWSGSELWGEWRDKFDFDLGRATGYGHSSEEVAKVKASAEQLLSYYNAVHEKATKFIKTLTEKDYAQVIDKNWDPPVTLATRLVSIINDSTQHAGQAAYVRGLLGGER